MLRYVGKAAKKLRQASRHAFLPTMTPPAVSTKR
jgi:hypothetical protein